MLLFCMGVEPGLTQLRGKYRLRAFEDSGAEGTARGTFCMRGLARY